MLCSNRKDVHRASDFVPPSFKDKLVLAVNEVIGVHISTCLCSALMFLRINMLPDVITPSIAGSIVAITYLVSIKR